MITIEQARDLYPADDSSHDFDHVLRVLQLAVRLGRLEGADLVVVRTAALLHDIGRKEETSTGRCHAQVGAEMARGILLGHSPEAVEAVAAAIREHRFRGDSRPSSLESQVLFDADKLDAIGAIGVARAYAYAGHNGQRLWARYEPDVSASGDPPQCGFPAGGDHTPVHEYRLKLARLPAFMITASGRALAHSRAAFMDEFFQRLDGEVEGRF